jgi:3-oxoacyl-(acyl-carrier-protein) synthase
LTSSGIVVTAYGIISSLGCSAGANLYALKNKKHGIGPIRHFHTIHKDSIPVAEVPLSNAELAAACGLDSDYGCTRTTLLALHAFRETAAGISNEDLSSASTGFVSANTVGGMDKSEIFYYDFLKNKSVNPYIDTHDCADSTETVARMHGMKGFTTTVSTACSSSANSIILAARMLLNGKLKLAIAGGTECLTRFHLNGFNSLKILDSQACKPFDARRNGINLGEGAAYLLLETLESALASGRKPLCRLTGWGNTCEAFHQTASSPDGDGAYAAMLKALTMAGLQAGDIGYINAHGTGTDNNDLSEGRAIMRLFGNNPPAVSSTKAYTGHTTSAAGAVEAIISILALNNELAFPNLNFSEKIPELSFAPVSELSHLEGIKHVMSNSFGFGGNNTSLIFSSIES